MHGRSMARDGSSVPVLDTGRRALLTCIVAMALGLGLIGGVGFAGADVLHNAAHDARHAAGFPCH